MPELPEVETVRRGLEPHVRGRTIVAVRVGDFAGVIGDEDPVSVACRLTGRRLEALRRRGKYLIADLDDGSALLIHLRMTGSLVLTNRAAPPVRFQRVAIELDDGNDVRFSDQRKFGRILHVLPEEVGDLDRRLGPEPLEARFTAADLADRLRRRSGPIKSVLLDQSLVAGLGNVYVDEALFRARLHPLRPSNALSASDVRLLHRAIRSVLREGLDNRGTSFSSFRDAEGRAGANQHNLRVYGRGRVGGPCPRCGTPLTRLVVGGRGSHVCLRCQPESSGV
jgi:formamidopyrimidine-DNA glycosylase